MNAILNYKNYQDDRVMLLYVLISFLYVARFYDRSDDSASRFYTANTVML